MAEKEELLVFLKNNLDVFAWITYEVLGVDLEFICHHLNVNPTIMPKRQPWQSSKEHAEVVKEEVNKPCPKDPFQVPRIGRCNIWPSSDEFFGSPFQGYH